MRHQGTKTPSYTKKNVIGYSLLVIGGELLIAAACQWLLLARNPDVHRDGGPTARPEA
jgi:hypothetical protein